eukprot:Clim_evm14s136 gene=Clim_evmTU14s136
MPPAGHTSVKAGKSANLLNQGGPGGSEMRRLYGHLNLEETPLPSAWNHKDRYQHLALTSGYGNLRVEYNGPGKSDNDAAAVRANYKIPSACGVYYFEVKIVNKGREGYIGIGLSDQHVQLNRLPGWEKNSYGYHGDDGHSFCCSGVGTAYGPTFTTGDVIGCCINFVDNTCFYTKNGLFLGICFQDLKPNLYPTVGLRTPGEVVEANFGQKPFEYDIMNHWEETRSKVKSKIESTALVSMTNSASWQSIMNQLVLEYLIHHGYGETAGSFANEIGGNISQDLQSIKMRQNIRNLMLSGDFEEAIKLTEQTYPSVLKDNEELVFKIRCRQFIEMVEKGFAGSEDMEQALQIMNFGQNLQAMCDSGNLQQSCKDELVEAFGLLAYPNPHSSPMGYLLSNEHREPLATALNSAILKSQEKPSQAALEECVQQLGACHVQMIENGIGASAFLSVWDILGALD